MVLIDWARGLRRFFVGPRRADRIHPVRRPPADSPFFVVEFHRGEATYESETQYELVADKPSEKSGEYRSRQTLLHVCLCASTHLLRDFSPI